MNRSYIVRRLPLFYQYGMRFRRPSRSRAFSLIEVTLALGILSSSVLVLVGLLTTGLDSLSTSSEQTTRTQILQTISEELSVAHFANVNTSAFYFDEEGQWLQDSSGARYKASLSCESPSLPGMSAPADLDRFQNHLKRVNVVISRADIPNTSPSSYSLQIANQGAMP